MAHPSTVMRRPTHDVFKTQHCGDPVLMDAVPCVFWCGCKIAELKKLTHFLCSSPPVLFNVRGFGIWRNSPYRRLSPQSRESTSRVLSRFCRYSCLCLRTSCLPPHLCGTWCPWWGCACPCCCAAVRVLECQSWPRSGANCGQFWLHGAVLGASAGVLGGSLRGAWTARCSFTVQRILPVHPYERLEQELC